MHKGCRHDVSSAYLEKVCIERYANALLHQHDHHGGIRAVVRSAARAFEHGRLLYLYGSYHLVCPPFVNWSEKTLTKTFLSVGNSSSSNHKVAEQAQTNLDRCIALLDHLSDACCAASQHRQILLDITSLGSTKLKSRDDADDLLSSRVPIGNPAKSNSSLASPASDANAQASPGSLEQNAQKAATQPLAQTLQKPVKQPPRHVQKQMQEQQKLKQEQEQQEQKLEEKQRQQQALHQQIQQHLHRHQQQQQQQQPQQSSTAEVAQAQGTQLQQSSLQPTQQTYQSSQQLPQQADQLSGLTPLAQTTQLQHPANNPWTELQNHTAMLFGTTLGPPTADQQHVTEHQPFSLNTPGDLGGHHNGDEFTSATTPSYYFQQPQPLFDPSLGLNGGTNGIGTPAAGSASQPMTNQADLAFWREMPIGCADPGDWNIFTDR